VPKPPPDCRPALPADPICYLAGGNGLFKQVKNDFYTARVKVGGVAGLAELEETAELHVPSLPLALFRKVEAFFAAAYAKYKGEAVVILLCNPHAETWHVEVPPQVVRGLHVSYDLSALPAAPDGFQRFGTIHSHAQAKAFHSGTDDSDEAAFDGLHITIGNVDSPVRSYSARWILAGKAFTADLADVVEGEPLPKCDPSWLEQVREESPAWPVTTSQQRQTRSCETAPERPAEFNPDEFGDMEQYREYLLEARDDIEERLLELDAAGKQGEPFPCFGL
jgi:hypothetical protein